MSLEWFTGQTYSLVNDDFTWKGVKARFSEKGIMFNKSLTEKLGSSVAFGFDSEKNAVLLKSTHVADLMGRKLNPKGIKGNSAVFVSPKFFAWLSNRGIKSEMILDFTFNEKQNYFEGVVQK